MSHILSCIERNNIDKSPLAGVHARITRIHSCLEQDLELGFFCNAWGRVFHPSRCIFYSPPQIMGCLSTYVVCYRLHTHSSPVTSITMLESCKHKNILASCSSYLHTIHRFETKDLTKSRHKHNPLILTSHSKSNPAILYFRYMDSINI